MSLTVSTSRADADAVLGPDPVTSTSKEDHNLGVEDTSVLHDLQTRVSKSGASLTSDKWANGGAQKLKISICSSNGSASNGEGRGNIGN